MRRALLPLALLGALGGASAGAQDDPVATGKADLAAARRAQQQAGERARRLEHAAAAARSDADKVRIVRAALAARIAAAEAEVRTARARVALVGELLRRRRAALAQGRVPVARLVGAVQSLARRPAWVSIAQPGSTDDLVHVRAVLGTVVPAMQARTTALRADVAQAARLREQAGVAVAALAAGNRALEAQRLALARAEAAQRLRAGQLARGAMVESDRAIALGERSRDLVDQLRTLDTAQDTQASLAALSGPLPRPGAADPPPALPHAYRLPVGGRLATGFGEVSDSGVRARGLTLAVAPGATVTAPAAGRIAYSARFRGYGRIVILDHGHGWTTLVTGLAASVGPVGGRVIAGTPIGRAPTRAPEVTIELRRQGVPVDLAAML